MAWTPEEKQRRERRRQLARGLVVGGAALGVPAFYNMLVARRAKRLPEPTWGEPEYFGWKNGTIAFRRLGKGPPLLLLHSFGPGYSSLQWQACAEMLATEHEVVAPDLLGWGDSDRPSRTYDGELYIELIQDLLADVLGRRAVLVASGLSAAYSIQVAVDQPESVRALGLVVPAGIDLHGDEPDLKDAVLHRLLRFPILGTSAMNLFTSRAGLAHHLRREVYSNPDDVSESTLDQHYRTSHLPGAHCALAAFLAGYLNHSVSPLLPRLEQPVWIAWGRRAVSPAVESADLWLRQLPEAQLEVFDHAAGQPQSEAPRDFSESLLGFLRGLRS